MKGKRKRKLYGKEKAFQKKSVEEVKRKRKDFGIDNAFQKKAVEEIRGKRNGFWKENHSKRMQEDKRERERILE